MADVFTVTATYDKPSYNPGDTIKITISGSAGTHPVIIDTSLPIVDTSLTPRNWAVSSDRLSISAVA